MRKLFLSFATVALCSAVLAAADDKVKVTVTGCVNPGTTPNTFVLTNVSERWPSKTIAANVIYWLSPSRQLNGHEGHMVEVTGTYSPSHDAGKTGTIKVEPERDGDAKIAVEHGSRKAEATGLDTPAGTSGVKTETKMPYRHLEVETIKTISDSCR
jgi:hypothetical protein